MSFTYEIKNNDCLKEIEKMKENSVDIIITDPPYEINYSVEKWDNTGLLLQSETHKKFLKVLKPGGVMLMFGHSRMFHRGAVAIEDAGFVLRDTVLWMYSNGFPKSQDISGLIVKNKHLDIQKKTLLQNQWQGWKTIRFKPAFEPIIVAQKPLQGGYVFNILNWNGGAMNIEKQELKVLIVLIVFLVMSLLMSPMKY
ncbi:DNA methyltransferase [Spiroplasma endosymbiont of Eupeodes luniger]|uniref:DNA methyltransferase n=1 Tax=Spiroplasma endosymbiont of Eupeodes luniger TaxID=3066300 RepID=UPI0030D22B30